MPVLTRIGIFFSMQDDDKPKLTETEEKKFSLQETRSSLPIFPFRNDLIQAIKDHQVSHSYSSKIRFSTVVSSSEVLLKGIVSNSGCIIEKSI